MATMCGLPALIAVGWMIVVSSGDYGPGVFAAGPAGAALVALVSLGSVLCIRPWKERPVSDWATLSLAGIVLRLLGTPVLAYLLYSATSLGLTPLMLSVAMTIVPAVIGEAIVLAHHVKRVT